MSAEIEQRLADVLRPGEPPVGSLQMALAHLDARAPARRALSRGRRIWSGVALAGTVAGFGALFVLALPRGSNAPAPAGSLSGFSVLGGSAFPDRSLVTPNPYGLGFPGVEPGSLRLARDLPTGVRVVVGRTGTGFVCLFAVPPRVAFRSGTCAPAADVRRAALVQRSWWNRSQFLVLVPDGTRVTTLDGRPITVRSNVAVLERTVRRVVLITPSGARRVRLDAGPPVPLTAAERRSPAVVPDLTGLTPGEAAEVLQAARLADGAREPQPAETVPDRILGQSPQPGATADAGTAIRLAVSTPAGPGGTRPAVAAGTSVRWTPRGTSAFRTDPITAFRGTPTVLLFADLRSHAEVLDKLGTPLPYPALVAVARDGGEAKALAFRRRRNGFAVAADPDGTLADALGVGRAPAVVVLDRDGRVAYRRAGRLDLAAIPAVLRALTTEPAPADLPVPDPPVRARYLQGGRLLDPEEVPQAIRSASGVDVVPQRVWAYGPSRSGWRAWIALNRPAPGAAGTSTSVFVSRHVPRGTRPTDWIAVLGMVAVSPGANPWVQPLVGQSLGGVVHRLWAVGPGYTSVITLGDAPIVNGLLEISGASAPAQIILNGPAGRGIVRVR